LIGIRFPAEFRIERLTRNHRRKSFTTGQPSVDDWLINKALQQQDKHLSVTNVLVDSGEHLAGFFTLAIGQVDFGDLPPELIKKLPKRLLPVAVLAWLGISRDRQGAGLGRLLLAQALRDCYVASQTFSFVAVLLDCLDDRAKSFYQQFDFAELPGRSYRLFLNAATLQAMIEN